MEKSTLEEDTEIYYSIIIENDASNTNVACDALIRTVCINSIDQVPKLMHTMTDWLTMAVKLWKNWKMYVQQCCAMQFTHRNTSYLRNEHLPYLFDSIYHHTNQTEDCIERHTNGRKGARQKRITGSAILYYCCDFSTKAQTIRRLRWIRGYSWHI